MRNKGTKLFWVVLLVGLIGLFGTLIIIGCGSSGDDDSGSDDDVNADDDTGVDDDTADDDTVTDDDTVVDDDADDDTIASDSIGGIATDFKSRSPLPNCTVEAVNDADGTSFDPQIIGTTDANGHIVLSGIPSGKGMVGVKVSYNGYKDTYEYHFETGQDGLTFYGVSNTTVLLVAGILGITPDATKGFASGAVYYVNADNVRESVGCAHVTFDPAVADVHYFANNPALGVIPTLARDWTADPPHDGQGTNPAPDGDGNPMSFFVGINADPGVYTVTADADTHTATATIPNLFADTVAITTVLFQAPDYTANPTPGWCTN